MFDDHVTRPWHFLFPAFLLGVAGIFFHFPSWEWVGHGIIVCSGVNLWWLAYAGYKREQLKIIQAQIDHDIELQKLEYAKKITKVVVDKTSLDGNYFSRSYSDLEISPIKLKRFAEGALGDKKLTIREWTPIKDGKLFSDPEWRRLIAFMKQPVKDREDIKFILPINPGSDQQSFELTRDGRRWLQDIMAVNSQVVHS